MWFQRLDIHDLRNLADVRLELSPGLNYFYGANGAGKTAVLEAVHLLARGRSFRSAQSNELIRHQADSVRVHARVQDEHRGEQSIGLSRSRNGRTELRINGVPGRRLSQAAELLPLQVMVPSLSDLVFGSPGVRRQWLDWGAFHVEHSYLSVLRSYLHAMRQRNAALKAVASGSLPRAGLDVWTEEVGRLGELVTEHREAYLEHLAPVLSAVANDLMPALDVTVSYRAGWDRKLPLRKVLVESVSREVKLGSTQSGPHRADVELRVGGADAGSTVSRGQGKALASAMMLSQARLLMKTARRASVFLIDDIGAELDLSHSERFFRQLSELGSQILATSNSRPTAAQAASWGGSRAPEPVMFHVEHGRIGRDTGQAQ